MKLFVIISALLLAGASATPTPVTREVGAEYAFTITAILQEISSCVLTTPAGARLEFFPGVTSQHGDRYELQPITSMPACSVLVKDLQSTDSGLWEIAFLNTAGTGNSQTFQVTVGAEVDDNNGGQDTTPTPDDVSGESKEVTTTPENDGIEWLEVLKFPTRIGQVVDISLPRINDVEICSLHRMSNNEIIDQDIKSSSAISAHEFSHFVSCRFTIGDMTEELLGDWAVCGKRTENNNVIERCQPATIYWNSASNPGAEWHTDTREEFDHPVHYEGTLSPVVVGNGEVVACHIVTPENEDFQVTPDSQYDGIKVTFEHFACRFDIGPISTPLLGNWVIYGLFTNSVEGLHAVRLPFSMHVYDQENPHNQAYNTSILDMVTRTVNMGNTLNLQVAGAGHVDGCFYSRPGGEVYIMGSSLQLNGAAFVQDNDGSIACTVAVGPITDTLLGEWTVIGKFSNNGIYTRIEQTFHVVEEDPENPIEDDRTITYLTAQSVHTEKYLSHKFVIPSHELVYGESCHIRTPDGLQYELIPGFNRVSGVEFVQDYDVECGVILSVVSEAVVGEWTLIARARHHSEPIERRLPITINVEEIVEASIDTIALVEGEDMYVSLKYPTEHFETCRLIGPYGFECQAAVRNPDQMNTCGFIRRNVQTFNTGTWTITYGDRIVYKAKIAVTVSEPENIASPGVTTTTLSLVRDRSVSQYVGPEDSVYCRLESPQGVVKFDSFGRCQLTLDKVGSEHHGTWKMLVAASGKVVAAEHSLIINVVESGGKPVVSTHVAQEKPIITIACSVQPASAQVTGCKFQDPHGKILIAASGLQEDRYSFYGAGASTASGVLTHECGIRINGPLTSDLGLWRCALETATETYFGHLPVLCPWALQQPEIAAVVQQVPILKSHRSLVTAVEEEPAALSCSVEANIRYCYFRAANGSIFTVSPGMKSSSMEYVGAGFDAGECGVRFHGLHATDSGRWGCHVGLVGTHEEQRDQFQLTVHERMSVEHFHSHSGMTVRGVVYEGRAVEYCRFVRIDGLGFTNENMPSQYTFTGILGNGECQFTARDPTILDLHPWTVAAKIRGQDAELSKDTMESLLIGGGGEEPEDSPPQIIYITNNGMAIFMYVFFGLVLVTILIGGLFGPKKNREWTAQRASSLRRSISNSFRKQPVQDPAPQYTP